MSLTKRQLINKAFSVAGLASFVFSLTPDQLQDALFSLDSQMGTWDGQGIRVGYPLTTSPENSDLDTETGLAANAVLATYLNLAVLIAPEHGKILSNDTQKRARQAFNQLLARHTQPLGKNLPTSLPSGAGHRHHHGIHDNFIRPQAETIDTAFDGEIELE